jgi:hypothetical protein
MYAPTDLLLGLQQYRFTERDGRKGPPAGNKARCNNIRMKWQTMLLHVDENELTGGWHQHE